MKRTFSLMVVCIGLSSCSMLIDDEAGSNPQLFPRDCLPQIRSFESDVQRELPGNASSIQFTLCQVDRTPYPVIRILSRVQLRQNVCKWGTCVTVWSYTTTVAGTGNISSDCRLESISLSMNPNVALLSPLLERAEREAPQYWPSFLEKHPEFRAVACSVE